MYYFSLDFEKNERSKRFSWAFSRIFAYTDTFARMIAEIAQHRTIRRFEQTPVPEEVVRLLCEAATRASNTGNMQLYSLITTTDPALRGELADCHFNQPAAQAPLLVTFCADIHRFGQWCEQRGTEPAFDYFLWFVNGAIDALLASQNFALEAEANGLGICYLGTTTYTARRIIRILKLPVGVVPVATLAVGYPAEQPPLTDRLPVEAIRHQDYYRPYSSEAIDRIWAEREASEETARLIAENELPNLARIFTERRYPSDDSRNFSYDYLKALQEQGFFEFNFRCEV